MARMLRKRQLKKGFSLIELLIVIAIIGIIATIAIPILLSARQNAIREKGRNSLRAVVSAQAAFYATNGRYATDMGELNAPPADPPNQTAYIGPTAADPGQGIVISTTGTDDTFTASAVLPGTLGTFNADETGEITGP